MELYRSFVGDLLAMLDALDVEVACCYQPADAKAMLRQWLGRHRWLVAQQGADLGRRMRNAFQYAFENGFSRAILIGSDSPDLAPEIVERALNELETHDVVIGPSSDGGYYLLGFKAERFLPEVFEDIGWSTDRVYGQTLQILERHERGVFVLPQWYDIVVIGAGSGGLVACKLAKGLGKRTALVEKRKIGGDCTWFGCVPSKTLIKSAYVAHQVTRLREFGIEPKGAMEFDAGRVMAHVRAVVETDAATHPPESYEAEGINILMGAARFIDPTPSRSVARRSRPSGSSCARVPIRSCRRSKACRTSPS